MERFCCTVLDEFFSEAFGGLLQQDLDEWLLYCNTEKRTRVLEGWLYLPFMFDEYSCKVVGRSAGNHLCTELVLYAPNMAIHHRCPAPGLVRRSDMGSRHISVEFGKAYFEKANCSLRWNRLLTLLTTPCPSRSSLPPKGRAAP